MKIVIIEDEALTAEDLRETLLKIDPENIVEAVLGSVREARQYFETHPFPELLFCDIQLGDGSIFDLLDKLRPDVPVIFCTAFNEHTLEAFKQNGIEYILKPFGTEDVRRALEKYTRLRSAFENHLLQTLEPAEDLPKPSQSLLVHYRDAIVPINCTEIAAVYISNQVTYVHTLANKRYTVHKTLDELEQTLSTQFFRANRNTIVNRVVIRDVHRQLNRKLSVNLVPPFETVLKITVSKTKSPVFLNWLKES